MSKYDYKKQVLDFSYEIKKIISQNLEKSDYKKLINLLHKMLFYAEQYFLEKELENRSNPTIIRNIREERKNVLQQLKTFADSISNFKNQTKELVEFLDNWAIKLSKERESVS